MKFPSALLVSKRFLVVPAVLASASLLLFAVPVTSTDPVPRDPGVRSGTPGAGGPLARLTANEVRFFELGREDFAEAEGVGDGLGPRFNLDGCGGCHSQPAIGGTSPAVNPQVAVATAFGALNSVPSFISRNGPIREARLKYRPDGTRDGGVHALFVISGRRDDTGDARTCAIKQPDFEREVRNNNVIFRIPTPVFGAGLIEAIPDSTILANMSANDATKKSLGISGRPNRNGNDGMISRFGWKAQNQSLLLFSGEAYNVEMGITNELFQVERDPTESCWFGTTPNDVQNTEDLQFPGAITAIENFANFQRLLAPPTPSTDKPGGTASISRGRTKFNEVGCALCHTPTLNTGRYVTVAALRNKSANLYSDLLLHQMGSRLADDIVQGAAAGDEFRTAPLWGLGQRIFFLHDGRTTDLLEAIRAHKSSGNSRFGPSEANAVIERFYNLGGSEQQDILNFLRSL
jgi:CxxC motif-containing protein (DUF1111 family)